jgi:hypothetical protein
MHMRAVLGWILSLALLVGIAGPLFGTCTQGDDSPWSAGLFVYAPVGLVGLVVAAADAKSGRLYGLLAVPHFATLILGIQFIPAYFLQTTIRGIHVCSVREGHGFDASASIAQQLWAPLWFGILLVVAYVVFLYWRGHYD